MSSSLGAGVFLLLKLDFGKMRLLVVELKRMVANLEKSILATLAYFDIFDYPLSKAEVFTYLVNLSFLDKDFKDGEYPKVINYGLRVAENLDELAKKKKIGEEAGFYFLSGREEIVKVRRQRRLISLKKIKKAKRVIWWLRFIPWIKAIFICSDLGLLNARQNSDIDLLVIAPKNRIWSARFWSAGILKLLNLRPKDNFVKDKFCLSHFITEDNLNLERTKIGEGDIHLIYLLTYYLPIYAEENLWGRFVESNGWIEKYAPNFKYSQDITRFAIKPKLLWLKKLVRKFEFNGGEKLSKKIQLKVMPGILREMMNKGKRVIVNDKMLKLHSNDNRERIRRIWLEKISKL